MNRHRQPADPTGQIGRPTPLPDPFGETLDQGQVGKPNGGPLTTPGMPLPTPPPLPRLWNRSLNNNPNLLSFSFFLN